MPTWCHVIRIFEVRRKVYRGRDIEVSFELEMCLRVGECLRGQRETLQLTERIEAGAGPSPRRLFRNYAQEGERYPFTLI